MNKKTVKTGKGEGRIVKNLPDRPYELKKNCKILFRNWKTLKCREDTENLTNFHGQSRKSYFVDIILHINVKLNTPTLLT